MKHVIRLLIIGSIIVGCQNINELGVVVIYKQNKESYSKSIIKDINKSSALKMESEGTIIRWYSYKEIKSKNISFENECDFAPCTKDSDCEDGCGCLSRQCS